MSNLKKINLDEKIFVAGATGMAGSAIIRMLETYSYGLKNNNGEMLGQEGFQDYIKKYQSTPNNKRLQKMIEDLISSGRIQKDDLTIVTVDG